MRLLLVRHGETDDNVTRRIQGPLLDGPLNARGRAQADALARRIAGERERGLRLDAIYASPLKRAWETAQAVATATGAPLAAPVPGLVEFSWGIFLGDYDEGATHDRMVAIHEAWAKGDLDAAPPGGESPARAWDRASGGLEPLLARHDGGVVGVVAHGRINKVLLAVLVTGDLSRMEDFPQANASFTVIEREPAAPGPVLARKAWRVVRLNETAHLSGTGTMEERSA